jgi:uncharacterized protein YecE (DUF72 family)
VNYDGPPRVGTAGWNIPRVHRDRFPIDGPQLARYAARLNATEINTSFYRPHAASTYERWAALVPAGFQFAVKVPRLITHDAKRGPLLVQLPPSLAFETRRVGRFLAMLRANHDGPVVCEPRHASWTSKAAASLLTGFQIARVAADPPRAEGLSEPAGWPGLVYYRMHGSPRPYFSPYSPERIAELEASLRLCTVAGWCIFDNTGSGSAAGHAVDLTERL